MAKVSIILWKHQKNKDKTCTIYIRVYKNKKVKLISTDQTIKPEDWDEKACRVKRSHKNHVRLNNLLTKMLHDAQTAALELETADTQATSKSIVRRIRGFAERDYFAFAADYILQFDNEAQRGTYKLYQSQLKKLRQFVGRESLSFDDIDASFLRRYETWLKSKRNKTNTIHGTLKRVRAVYYAAIKEGIADQGKNPFFIYKLKVEKTKRERLAVEELNRIRALQPSEGTVLWHAKNMFLLSFNCMGMRISDVLLLRWNNVHGNRLEYKMKKTKEQRSIILSGEAKKILELYSDTAVNLDAFIFPILKDGKEPLYDRISNATALINKFLRQLAAAAEINKKLTTHVARHSWANMARELNINMKTIQKGLGHGSLRTTETYLSDFNDGELDAANELITAASV